VTGPSINLADEIVQDFLVEAGEILDQLGEQLVDLEVRAEDTELLNAVFRGFHTIKGGAGFLGLAHLVELCHRAEDVFNLLRRGERRVDPGLVDAVLKALDAANEMFRSVRAGALPDPAPGDVLEALAVVIRGEGPPLAALGEAAVPLDPVEEVVPESVRSVAPAEAAPAPTATAPDEGTSGEISEEEFEALLDSLHGAKRHGGLPVAAPAPEPTARREVRAAPPLPPAEAKTTEIRAGTGGEAPGTRTGQGEPTVRVDTGVLDHIMNMVGELVLARNRLVALVASRPDEDLAKAVGSLDVVTADLQAGVMRTRMQPIRKVFSRFPRVVRDLARSLGKDVVLDLSGEDTDLDKNLVEALADPLVHLVRNAVDHGVEPPEVRERAGKPRKATVRLAAQQEGDHILLSISDDGAGMDADLLRRKAVEKGLLDAEAAARLDDRECFNLIFLPGFSTKAEISDVSGRGVGMDVVKTRIAQLNGSVEVDSTRGVGTLIRIKVPLTLAIVPTLMVMLGSQIVAFPLVNVSEIVDLADGTTHTVDGQLLVQLRSRPLPLYYLGQWVAGPRGPVNGEGTHVVVVQVGSQLFGFVVDQLLGQEEVVIKPLGALLHGLPGLAGATITGDGRIALVLDVPSLVRTHVRSHRRVGVLRA
jgi:two-component system chemotaxis sensor kinase CheA